MTFDPHYTMTQRMVRQIVAIERTNGFLKAVRLRGDWLARLRREIQVEDALASVQIEGSSLTLERAFELAHNMDEAEEVVVPDAEREFLNYLRTFNAIEALHNDRQAVLSKGDLLNIHRSLLMDVRGGKRMEGQFRRENVEVGDLVDGVKTIHHQPPPWSVVENEIQDLLDWVEVGKEKGKSAGAVDPWIHPAIIAGIAQHRLVWIHPFLDGNGRAAECSPPCCRINAATTSNIYSTSANTTTQTAIGITPFFGQLTGQGIMRNGLSTSWEDSRTRW